jgi:hypothetical protein
MTREQYDKNMRAILSLCNPMLRLRRVAGLELNMDGTIKLPPPKVLAEYIDLALFSKKRTKTEAREKARRLRQRERLAA